MSIPNTPLSEKQARATLERISLAEDGTLRGAVAQEAIDFWHDDPRQMFTDLAIGGCQSGIIKNQITYADTHAFFDAHYDEIERLRDWLEHEVGERIDLDGDLKTLLSWFAFERTAFRMAYEDLGLEF